MTADQGFTDKPGYPRIKSLLREAHLEALRLDQGRLANEISELLDDVDFLEAIDGR